MSDDAHRPNEKPEHLDRAAGLWRRVSEHKLVQWAVAYVAVAYAIQHGVILTAESLEWPGIVARVSMLLLALGLPLVMLLAWYHGHHASRHVSKVEFSIISLLLVVGSLWFYVFVKPSEEATASRAPAVQQASIAAARNAAADPHGAISVAVLPFVNLSSDKEQEFFSDGMTEEITTALAKVPDLRVVGRTSAFQFKGTNQDLRAIGQALSATHLIEGSVRKAGNRVRITAQLIKADDGTHIWAEDYDRELTDVFAIQEGIARAITASLHMTLGLKPGENLVNNRAIDSESYEKVLRARAMFVARGGALTVEEEVRNSTEALRMLESVVAKHPTYAPGWAALGVEYGNQLNNSTREGVPLAEARRLVAELAPKAEAAEQKAIQLDPNLAEPYTMIAWLARARGRPAESEDFLTKALAVDPLNSDTLFVAGMLYGSAGRVKEALEFYEKGHAVDPFYPNLAQELVQDRWLSGQNDAAIALAKTLRPLQRAGMLSLVYASMGRFGDAADSLKELANDPVVAETASLLRNGLQKLPSSVALPRLAGRNTFDMLYLYLGAPERALEGYERRAEMGHINGNRALVWHPDFTPVRKTERFKALMRKIGYVDYWRAKGWPPQCHPTTGDDFACE